MLTNSQKISIDQYLHSGTTFLVPLTAAIFLNKDEFAYVAFHLIICSAFIGILNSSTVYLRNYYNKESVISLCYVLITYVLFAILCKYLFFPGMNFQSSDSIIFYCVLLLITDNNRKIVYLLNCNSLKMLLGLRILGILIACLSLKFSVTTSILVIFLFTSLQFPKSANKAVEKARSLQDYKQLLLFTYSYLIANLPIYVGSRFVGNDIFADARILQLIFSGGAFILMPLEMITIKKNKLQFRSSFTKLESKIVISQYLIFLYLSLAVIILQAASFVIQWLEVSIVMHILLLVTWSAHIVVIKQTIKLKAKNETMQQYIASTVSAMIGLSLIFAFALYPNLPVQLSYAVYLTLLSCFTTIILLKWAKDD